MSLLLSFSGTVTMTTLVPESQIQRPRGQAGDKNRGKLEAVAGSSLGLRILSGGGGSHSAQWAVTSIRLQHLRTHSPDSVLWA